MFRSELNEETKFWNGSGVPIVFDTNISIAHIILRSMRIFGSKTAQISADSGARLTFDEIRLHTIRIAQNLQCQGYYKAKQVIGIMADNSEYLSSIVFATFCLGCPINSLSTFVGKQDVMRMYGITKPSIVFCDVNVYDLIEECLNELNNKAKIYTFNGTKGDSEAVEHLLQATGTEDDFIPVSVDANNDALAIMSSSGTTGECKGVCLSHASMIAQITMFDVATANDILFSSSSLNWMIGLVVNLLNIFSGATRIISSKPFSPETQNQIIKDYEVTVVIGQSYYIIECLKSHLMPKADLSSVKHMIVAGYKLPLSAIEEFNQYLPNGTLNNSYGLTETSGFVTVDYPTFSGNDSVGRLLGCYGFKIVNDDDNGQRCGIDVEGEICIKTPKKFLGYFNNQKLTEQALDSEGFVLTGDIGRVDKDGNLYIIGRKKDVIIYYHTIIPTEIEALLLKSPFIYGVCVVGVVDETSIELPAAIVVRTKDSSITEVDICEMVANNMPDYCKLRGRVYFVDAIPTTPSGKIIRRLAKEMAIKMFNAKTSSKGCTG